MKYIVAVSGGVDSVTLLDMLVREKKHQLVVAHFDHGIRPESDADARFVAGLANTYGLTFETKREELGGAASEATARTRRYAFLREVTKKYQTTLVTAHHADDVIETIAINLIRGTGWRGLAVFGNSQIERPLISMSKHQLREYALKHHLEWVEDETNQTTAYLRNRVRRKLSSVSDSTKEQLVCYFESQQALGQEIEKELDIYQQNVLSRYFMTMTPSYVALELLRRATDRKLTRPQLEAVLLGIKTARPGTTMTAGNGIIIRFTTRKFIVENTGEML